MAKIRALGMPCACALLPLVPAQGAALIALDTPYQFHGTVTLEGSASGVDLDTYSGVSRTVYDLQSMGDSYVTENADLMAFPVVWTRDDVNVTLLTRTEATMMASSWAGVDAGDDDEGSVYYDPNKFANMVSLSSFTFIYGHAHQQTWSPSIYTVGASAQTSLWQTGFAEYQIQPRLKDKAGDPIRVSVIPGSAGTIRHDGAEYDASSTNWIEARIGDVIGLQLISNHFSGGWTGPAEPRGMVGSYLFYTGESGFKSLGLSIGLTGGLSESAPIAATLVDEAGAHLFDGFFPEGSTGEFGVGNPVWIEMDTISHDYEISITDNALVSLTLPSYLPGAAEMRVLFYNADTGEWQQAGYDDGDGNFFYFPGGEVMFDLPATLVRLENIGWDSGDLPAAFALGLQFAGTGTEVSVLPTSPIPEPGIAGFLVVILGVVVIRRRRRI